MSLAIMAHPVRGQWVKQIREAVGYEVPVVFDRNAEGVWPTARRAWELGLTSGATHHCVVQDDTLPCRDFVAGAEKAIERFPEACIAFFSSILHGRKLHEGGKRWMQQAKVWGQAPCFPVEWIQPFFEWQERHIDPTWKTEDGRLSAFLHWEGLPIYATLPSLVEHVGHNDSLLGHHPPVNRKAGIFIGAEESALSVDWTVGEVVPCKVLTRRQFFGDYGSRLVHPEEYKGV